MADFRKMKAQAKKRRAKSLLAQSLLAVLAVCLLPLVRLGVQYLVYKAAAFLAGILGAEQLTGLIDALGGAFGLIFGMTGACGLLLLISISSALGVVTG